MRKPLLTMDRFISDHRKFDRMIKKYLLSKKGQKLYDEGVLSELKDQASLSLPAINRRARIAFARAAYVCSKEFCEQHRSPAYLLTFTLDRFATLLSDAADFEPEAIVQWTKRRLGDWHFFGVVEAALFTNIAQYFGAKEPTVSWHVHLVVWGCKEVDIQALVDDVNACEKSLVPGRDPADLRKLSPNQVPSRFLYILKVPLSEYRIRPVKDFIDASTGEIVPQFDVQKRSLRPGDAVRICKALVGCRLPDLVFAGGDGQHFKLQIEKDARQLIERHNARNTDRLRACSQLTDDTDRTVV